jgi:hypothetical protein
LPPPSALRTAYLQFRFTSAVFTLVDGFSGAFQSGGDFPDNSKRLYSLGEAVGIVRRRAFDDESGNTPGLFSHILL